MNPARSLIAGVAVSIVLIGAGVWWWQHAGSPTDKLSGSRPGSHAEDQPKPLYWYDPMHPDRHFDAPGKSPFMDMALVPKYGEPSDGPLVKIDAGMVQRLGIRTTPVVVGALERQIDTTGRIEIDERTLHQVTVRAPGWVEVLDVRAEGEPIKRGQRLAEIFSPALETAQREFVLALAANDADLIEGARAQLQALGFDTRQLAELERTRQVSRRSIVYSPIDGFVMRLVAREGAAVEPGGTLFELASHDPVWVIAAIPEAQADMIASDDPVEVRVAAHPGRVFTGRVDYLYPALDMATRTRRARIVLANHDDVLHPGMYTQVSLSGNAKQGVLLVPADAVIRTGTRNVVIVAEQSGVYRPVSVRLGDEHAGTITILEGLAAGDQVVVSGQFLIDSEASLQGAYRRMAPAEEQALETAP